MAYFVKVEVVLDVTWVCEICFLHLSLKQKQLENIRALQEAGFTCVPVSSFRLFGSDSASISCLLSADLQIRLCQAGQAGI